MNVLSMDRMLVTTPDIDSAVTWFGELFGLAFGSRVDPSSESVGNEEGEKNVSPESRGSR